MSVGTRKKFVDFHKILYDDVSHDSLEDNKLHKSLKKHGDKLKKKNSREKNFLGNKREHVKSLKSDKKGKQNEPGKKLNPKKILRNFIKSKKYPKNHILKISEKANSKFEDNTNSTSFYPKSENEPIAALTNKHSSTNTTSKRKDKAGLKNEKLEKEEFSNLLTQNREEYLYLGIDIEPLKDSLQNGNFDTINSDFTSLTLDLFASTKFENSKPFKMIDYILNSDSRYLTSVNDKETYEDIKKTIYNRRPNLSDDSQIVFKSLYPYFKTDFSISNIYKIFECCNGLIEKFYYPDIESSNPVDSFGGFFFDKKDKFTYQNYLMDRLRNNNNDWMKEIYDKEMIKSLIYLCNKHMKQSFKVMNGTENNFVNVLKENLKFLEECENEIRQSPNIIENVTFKNIKKKLLDNKEISRVLKKKFRRLFSFKKFCSGESLENVDIKRLFTKLLELFTKLKEDEYEKILIKLQKIEKEFEKDKKINFVSSNTDKDFKNVKSFWIKFKIIFYLVTLGNPEIKRYITDESFWRLIIDYVKEKKAAPQQEIHPIEIATNTKPTRLRKDKKRNDKEPINDTPKKQIPIETTSEIIIQENIQSNLTTTPNKFFILNTVEKNLNFKIPKEEEKSFTANPLDIMDNINNEYFSDIKAYELVEMEFNKNILTKIANKEKLFKVAKSPANETKKRKKRKAKSESNLENGENVERSEGEENVLKENNEEKDEKDEKEGENKIEVKEEEIEGIEEIVIKPKTVRVKPGFNAKGNILINNFYNIINNNSEPNPLTILQNFSHQFENEKVMEIITQNKEGIIEPEIKRKKGRPKKAEIKVQQEENNIESS